MIDRSKYEPLGKIVEIIGGGTPSKAVPAYYGGSIPWATVRDMNSEVITTTEVTITELGKRNSSTNVIPAGNIVIATRVGLGKVCFLAQDTAINQDLKGIVPKDSVTDIRFIYWWFKFNADKIIKAGTGVTVQGVKLPFIKALPFPILAIEDQREIVATLDKAFAAIDQARANVERNIVSAEQLFDTYLNDAFENLKENKSWSSIGSLLNTTAGGTPLKSVKEYYSNGHIPWLKSGEVGVKNIINNNFHITESGLNNSSAKMVPENSVLIAMYGATAGEVGILRFRSATNQAVCAILPNKYFVPEFLYYYFLYTKQALISQAVGNAQPNISQQKIKALLIPVLTVEEQNEFIRKLEMIEKDINRLISIYYNKMDLLRTLKESALHECFTQTRS